MKALKRNNVFCFSILLAFTIIFSASCNKNDAALEVNGPAPTPSLPSQPYMYGIGSRDLEAALGRVLFYDKNLSLNNSISCGSCHKQQYAFADNHQFSRGLNNGLTTRNASTILSSPNHNKFWDGRAGNMDTAVFMPVQNHLEMNMFSLDILPQKLSQLSYYGKLYQDAYGSSEITVANTRKALATFVSTLNSYNSKYDRSMSFSSQKEDLTSVEIKGKNIFFGKGNCYQCHSGEDFNGYNSRYENIGLEVNYTDKGRGKITKGSEDEGKFQVPTLRNVALTAPYMHDGRYKTLREVIDHYNEGVQNDKNLSYVLRDIPESAFRFDVFGNPVPMGDLSSYPAKSLGLKEDEKKALEAFLNTLSDVTFTTDPKFSNPFR